MFINGFHSVGLEKQKKKVPLRCQWRKNGTCPPSSTPYQKLCITATLWKWWSWTSFFTVNPNQDFRIQNRILCFFFWIHWIGFDGFLRWNMNPKSGPPEKTAQALPYFLYLAHSLYLAPLLISPHLETSKRK